MPKKNEITVTAGSGNVFADLLLPKSGELQTKAELTRQIFKRIQLLKLSQAQAARRLELKQPDVSKLMHGRHTGFSIERLLKILNALEVDVEIVLHAHKKSGTKARPATVRVVSEIPIVH